ncbi:MAG: hypothetical protein GOMPHAMPRED_000083 [Gomphillus americanus]|uniref:Uncharacterized protein n=1 Tax=Gomphillus americanus TaxID=1940652 RepID=A0A8H3ED62_9LECA|nr:MAG: hypothetical protein GOMPHAMPRED_000083 [Gomphillus americanus]
MAQPQQSSTVPHGFHFHYDEQPKTPERELSPPAEPTAEPARGGFRIRRRQRPRVDTGISTRTSEIMAELHETALPSIEISEQEAASVEPEVQPVTIERLLTPQRAVNNQPQTPAGRREQRAVTPMGRETANEAFKRPSSPFSGISDSDDEDCFSIGSEDGQSHGGSVTSPEDDTADPFHYEYRSKPSNASSPSPQFPVVKKYWTKEMDAHIWKVYNSYMNDPTNTPFKGLPGCPPPIGVCHRVASEARKTWKGPRTVSGQLRANQGPGRTSRHFVPWPGAGSATRRRFRELCRRKATITRHYQRMMRTPSPQVGDARVRSTRTGSPIRRTTPTRTPGRNSFATRDVAMSLAASISTTMQPDGPLAQMTNEARQSSLRNPYVAPDVNTATVPSDNENKEASGASTNRLGSPFSGSNTWGPSVVEAQGRSFATNLMPPGSTSTAPRLGSPVQFASMRDTQSQFSPFPARMTKRPATSALGEDVTNGDAAARKIRHEDVSGTSFMDASRRLRLRGMSLGARFAGRDHYVSEPSTVAGAAANETSLPYASLPPQGLVRSIPLEDPFYNPPQNHSIPRLRSPFPGIGTRPSRGRHASSLSLPSVTTPDLGSLDQRMSEDIAE